MFLSIITADTADVVRDAALGWTRAVVKQDKAALDRLLGEDLTFAYSDGTTIQNKEQYIASVTGSEPEYETLALKDVIIHPYGKAAIVSALVDTRHPGRNGSYAVRFMQLYVEKNGQWQMAASGATQSGTERSSASAGISGPASDRRATAMRADDPESAAVRETALGWTRAMVDKDRAAIEPLLADDLLFGHSNGGTPRTKAEHLLSTERNAYEALPLSDVDVRVYGHVAVLTANVDTKNVGRDPFRVRTIQMFVKNNGHWQLAAFQSTRVTPP
jgi:ketosteroid isomerase-like protein